MRIFFFPPSKNKYLPLFELFFLPSKKDGNRIDKHNIQILFFSTSDKLNTNAGEKEGTKRFPMFKIYSNLTLTWHVKQNKITDDEHLRWQPLKTKQSSLRRSNAAVLFTLLVVGDGDNFQKKETLPLAPTRKNRLNRRFCGGDTYQSSRAPSKFPINRNRNSPRDHLPETLIPQSGEKTRIFPKTRTLIHHILYLPSKNQIETHWGGGVEGTEKQKPNYPQTTLSCLAENCFALRST